MITETAMIVLSSLADSADARSGMPGHSRRVTALVARTIAALGTRGKEAQLMLDAARLHDIGKLGVPETALVRRQQLTPMERSLVRRHADRGAAYLRGQPGARPAAEIVLHHHERFDGDGYPGHMTAENIPLGSRVIAVAECFDALTHDSPYRSAVALPDAIGVLTNGAGQQWDAHIVDAFLHVTVPELVHALQLSA